MKAPPLPGRSDAASAASPPPRAAAEPVAGSPGLVHDRGWRRIAAACAAASVALLAVRLWGADRLGFGDAEALYACYALHPQPVYLDHPGLVGLVARALGGGGAPTPTAAHRVTALVATLVPWLGALTARALGASSRGALFAAVALLVTPEIAIGLFGLTPDLLLVLTWYAALASAAVMMKARPGSLRALVAALATGLFIGLACDAKASGVLLALGIFAAFGTRGARPHLRTVAPWAAAALATVMVYPAIAYELDHGFPMLRHRLLSPEAKMGLSLRNLGALIGGQLLYLSPAGAIAAVILLVDLYRTSRRARADDDGTGALLFWTTVASAPLLLLVLVSGAAEPHWVAPLYLSLPLHLARRLDRGGAPPAEPEGGRSWTIGDPRGAPISRRLALFCVGSGAALVAIVYAAVLTPFAARLLGSAYHPRFDLTNDLYAWREGIPAVADALSEDRAALDAGPAVVVGPHWVVCAQLHAALPLDVFVGCAGPAQADFAGWLPSATWREAPVVYYVTDDRFGWALPEELRGRAVDGVWSVVVQRGGVSARKIRIERLVDRERASVETRRPASHLAVGAPLIRAPLIRAPLIRARR